MPDESDGPAPLQDLVHFGHVPIHRVRRPRLRRSAEAERIDQQQTIVVGEGCDAALPVTRRVRESRQECEQAVSVSQLTSE